MSNTICNSISIFYCNITSKSVSKFSKYFDYSSTTQTIIFIREITWNITDDYKKKLTPGLLISNFHYIRKSVKNRTYVCQDKILPWTVSTLPTMNVYYKSNPYQKVDMYIIPNILIALLLRIVHIEYIIWFFVKVASDLFA